ENHDPTDEFRWLVALILRAALPYLNDSQILEAYAGALLSRLRKHDFTTGSGIVGLPDALLKEPGLNLKMVEAMLPQMENPDDDATLITRWGLPLLKAEDLDWLLNRLERELSPETQKKLCHLIFWIFYPQDAKS